MPDFLFQIIKQGIPQDALFVFGDVTPVVAQRIDVIGVGDGHVKARMIFVPGGLRIQHAFADQPVALFCQHILQTRGPGIGQPDMKTNPHHATTLFGLRLI